MRRQILKRLETLERAADTEVFANALVYPIAYYLGGAKHESEAPRAIARALGYHDLEELCQALVALLRQPLSSDMRARAAEAQRELLAKFGYDPRPTPIYLIYGDRPRPSPAFADAAYRIVATLPDEWRAAIKSAHRERCEAKARQTKSSKYLTELLEEMLAVLNRANATGPKANKKVRKP
jgi:hypothetical protein